MAARKLASFVHVEDTEGNYRVFGPDDDVPAEYAKLITNPKAWQAESGDDSEDSESTTVRTGRRRSTS